MWSGKDCVGQKFGTPLHIILSSSALIPSIAEAKTLLQPLYSPQQLCPTHKGFVFQTHTQAKV